MTTELAKTYDPKSVEKDIYDLWEQRGSFNAEPGRDGRSFCMVIPPPNVTAALHVGHALNNTLQDVLIRVRRMQQLNTLWMPGTDHAGIATQTVVEKRLLAEEGKKRTDFERDEFVARVQDWKDEYEATILAQLQKMGCSCDWRRTRFTMDEVCARAVRETFMKLLADGLIYRGKRLVNWDPATQTVLADDEVEHEEVTGNFWYMRYPLTEPVTVDGYTVEHVTVATTRPETMLGDTAVAMNPRDPRAEALIGKTVRLPIVGREIPIIGDEHVVLPDPDSEDEKARFSTGFLKVTPAHDPDDYAIGERHIDGIAAARRDAGAEGDDRALTFVNVMAPDGSISDRHGWDDADTPEARNLIGMDRFEAREAIVEFFRRENLLEKVEPYTHSVGHSYRSHVPIEPYLSDQWYVAVKKPIANLRPELSVWISEHPDLIDPRDDVAYLKDTDVPATSLAGLALAPLLDGRLTFVPERYTTNYQTWLENLRDWPISRQLWWGHRIPVWRKRVDGTPDWLGKGKTPDADARGEVFPFERDGFKGWWTVRNEDEGQVHYAVTPYGAEKLEETLEAEGWQQDPDVLDTWFSSGLWPFSTLGWPEPSEALKTWYPGDVLCTAREIITLWVSRMVMMGQYCAGDIPFHTVFIHAMIQDGQGRKMSKSLGNGIDPLIVVDSHGADAMRFTLTSMTTQTQDVRMPVESMELPDGRMVNTSPKFDIGRNFCNKLWNASRFAMMNLSGMPAWDEIRPREHLADRWILSRLNETVRDVTGAVDQYRFNELAETLYHFMWDDFCDWYLEIAKTRISAGEAGPKAIVAHCLDVLLRLLHPLCPFVTEAIWQKLGQTVPARGPGNFPAEPELVSARWPQADAAAIDRSAEQDFARLAELVRGIRNVRMQHSVPPSKQVEVLVDADEASQRLIRENAELVGALAHVAPLKIEPVEPPPADAAAVTLGTVKAYVCGIIDREAERARLTKQKETLEKGIRGIKGKLANENFVTKAPAEVVQRERERLEQLKMELGGVDESLQALA